MAVETQRKTPELWVSHGTQPPEMPLPDARRLSQEIIRRHEDTVLTRAHFPSWEGWSW